MSDRIFYDRTLKTGLLSTVHNVPSNTNAPSNSNVLYRAAFASPDTIQKSATVDIVAFPSAPSVQQPTRPSATPYRSVGKRFFDVVVVIASAPVWLTIIAIAALFVMLDGHNPFYTQERVGRNGRVFHMLKLRSMVMRADEKLAAYLETDPKARAEWDATQKLKTDPRITRVGRIIRKTSFDELPQLLNVLKGDMSLVGPRPFMVSQSDLYDGRAYYDMDPGLTGPWQISDRNECSFAQRVGFDESYHSAVSLKEDLRILVGTVSVVLRGTGY